MRLMRYFFRVSRKCLRVFLLGDGVAVTAELKSRTYASLGRRRRLFHGIVGRVTQVIMQTMHEFGGVVFKGHGRWLIMGMV
jgi:hypothetical protein